MAHIRKTIRENVKTAITGLSTTGTSVYETRYFPLQTGNLPALIVYTLDETIEEETSMEKKFSKKTKDKNNDQR